jgi:exosome complex component CSL4
VDVLPGDPLGVVEELAPGPGVYVDSRGVLRAAVRGRAVIDYLDKVAQVRPLKRVKFPRMGDDVVGVVTQVRHDLVVVEVYGAVSLTPRPRWLYETPGPISSGLPIANVSEEYVKDLSDYYRLGDMVLARVVSRSTPYTLSTKSPQHGVLYAYCGRCGALMGYKSDRSMVCGRCGNVESRKVSLLARSPALRIEIKRHLVKYRYPW